MRPRRLALAALAALALVPVACGSSGDASSDGADGGSTLDTTPGADTTVTVFDQTAVHFTSTDNTRNVDTTVTFPDTGLYQSITLHLSLACPSNRCDPYDRFGSLGIRPDPTKDDTIEVARFITPFGVGASWDLDVTDLRPLLKGTLAMRGFIDTWVGPGSAYGNGWLLSASFEMKGGTPDKVPVSVTPVWNLTSAVYGDPAKTIASQVVSTSLSTPAGATSYALRAFVTGHGQGNKDNCAEFCQKTHTLTVGGDAHDTLLWRDDCKTTAAPNQQGTYQYPRAGWCPGADVKPWIEDVTADVTGASTPFAYSVEDYENTCRPDSATCTGCSLGTGCAYDDGSHTEPHWFVSALLVAYR